jgi:hypothetical protein
MAGLTADLALGRVEDEDGAEHNVTVAVLIGPQGVAWQSRAAWGVGPGSALAGARLLDLVRDDVNEQWPQADIDWSVIEQIMTDLEDKN